MILDHSIVSGGLLRGEAGQMACLKSVSIFKHVSMTARKTGQPRGFEISSKQPSNPATGASDHFPITMLIATDTAPRDPREL